MIYAIYTSLCWAFSAFGSSRISRHFGSAYANGIRLASASVILLAVSLGVSGSLVLPGTGWFALSGILHLAVGDLGLFVAYRRLGPRIAVLMIGSFAPLTALVLEWWTLGNVPEAEQLLCGLGILIAVGTAVAPKERVHLSPRELKLGLLGGTIAAVGQGAGAAVSRIAFDQLGDVQVSFWLPVFYRVSAAAGGVWVWILLQLVLGHKPFTPPVELIPDKKVEGHPLIWLAVSTLMGPVIGMWFLMRAFDSTASSLVQAALATLPIFMMPVAWVFDGTVPSRRSMVAGLVAVCLTATLVML